MTAQEVQARHGKECQQGSTKTCTASGQEGDKKLEQHDTHSCAVVRVRYILENEVQVRPPLAEYALHLKNTLLLHLRRQLHDDTVPVSCCRFVETQDDRLRRY